MVLALIGQACNYSLGETEPLALIEALAVPIEDRKGKVLETMGGPDSFTIIFAELEGQLVRSEQWSYHGFDTRFDFLDGELLWTLDLEPVPDGTIYAHAYDPTKFVGYMSMEEVRELLADEELEEIDLTEGDLPEGTVLVGEQILLGFDEDRLVYVETILLSPEGSS